ncbi:MAG: precorrin-6y C5,15-methyltransferase (decarboxylating) subunit CbiE [Chloroflexota bacterium]
MPKTKAYIVGVGPGSPDHVTPGAQRAIGEAQILVGWEFNFLPVQPLAAGKKVYLQRAADYIRVAENAAEEARRRGETVAVLRIGDPCISGGLDELLRIFHDFEVEIIPGISSVQAAAAIARVNLDESVVISFHEDKNDLPEKLKFMLEAFNQRRHLIVLNGQVKRPDEVAGYLIENGVSPDTPVIVGENLTLEDERIFRGTLQDIITGEFSWLAVMVILQAKE